MALVTNERALRPVALKKVHITNQVKYPPLLHEAAALLQLRGWFSPNFLFAFSRYDRSSQAIVAFLRCTAGGVPNTSSTFRSSCWDQI